MTKNYDPNWSWPEVDIPVMVMGSMPDADKSRVLQAENPFAELAKMMDESMSNPPAGLSSEALEAVKAMAAPFRDTIGKLADSVAQAGGKERISLFPIRSARLRYLPDGTPYRKAKVEVLAHSLGEQLGFMTASDIYQIADANRSADATQDVNSRQCYFEGEIERGHSYIIVDDCINSGRTIRDATRYIELNGGKVAGVLCQSTLPVSDVALERPSNYMEMYLLKPDPATMEKFNSLFSDKAVVNVYLGKALLSVDQLTAQEIKGLIRGFETSNASNLALTPEQYLQEKTKDWQAPEKPADFERASQEVISDVDLAAIDTGFFGKGASFKGRPTKRVK